MRKREKIKHAARYSQINMENAIKMVSKKHDYHAPQEYGFTKKRFAGEVSRVEKKLLNDIIIGNICKAYIERSKFLTWRVNKITKWIDEMAKEIERKEKIEREKKAKENAEMKTEKPEAIPMTGLNRKQRRKIERQKKKEHKE